MNVNFMFIYYLYANPLLLVDDLHIPRTLVLLWIYGRNKEFEFEWYSVLCHSLKTYDSEEMMGET
jgi:hypothetical protein